MRPEYLEAIDRGKEAIVDGEVFQVVISRRFEMECAGGSPGRLSGAPQHQSEPLHVHFQLG